MTTKRLAMAVTLGLLGLALALLGLHAAPPDIAQAADVSAPLGEITVCMAGPPSCQYDSIQDAVDAANAGDVIKVATGTYSGVNNYGGLSQLVFISKTVIIQGGYTPANWTKADPETNPTTLDAQGQGRVIYVTGNIAPVIEGLRITGGEASGLGSLPGEELWDGGGGVYVITASATIQNNQIYSNSCSSQFCGAGGIFIAFSDATISDNRLFLNYASWDGGGLEALYSDATVEGNEFDNNTVGLGGGGAYLHMSNVTFSANRMISNTAQFGGGLVSAAGIDVIANNVIADNHATTAGGGLWVYGSSPQVVHNTIARNSGGDGSGVYVSQLEYIGPFHSMAAFTNTVLVSHSLGIRVTGGNTVTVDSVLWHSTPITVSQSPTAVVSLLNQYTGDPAFAPDGYHLAGGSAAIDKGMDAGVFSDIDGESRPAGEGHDLGADELWWHKIYLPLVLRNA